MWHSFNLKPLGRRYRYHTEAESICDTVELASASWRMGSWSLNGYVADIKKISLFPAPTLPEGNRPLGRATRSATCE